MPDGRRSESGLDRALDAALADLTDASPPQALRERVFARIASGPAEPRPARLRVRWSVAIPSAAAVAALAWSGSWLTHRTNNRVAGDQAAAVVGASPSTEAVSPPPGERPVRAPGASGPRLAPRQGPIRAAAGPRRAPPATTRTAASGGVRPSAAADDPGALPPLDPPAPVAPAELSVASTREPVPIDVPSLRVEPLMSGAEDGSTLP